jgi:hypothetical protein
LILDHTLEPGNPFFFISMMASILGFHVPAWVEKALLIRRRAKRLAPSAERFRSYPKEPRNCSLLDRAGGPGSTIQGASRRTRGAGRLVRLVLPAGVA